MAGARLSLRRPTHPTSSFQAPFSTTHTQRNASFLSANPTPPPPTLSYRIPLFAAVARIKSILLHWLSSNTPTRGCSGVRMGTDPAP